MVPHTVFPKCITTATEARTNTTTRVHVTKAVTGTQQFPVSFISFLLARFILLYMLVAFYLQKTRNSRRTTLFFIVILFTLNIPLFTGSVGI